MLIQTPVYNNFFNSIRNNGRNVVENELLYDGKEYRIDWEKLEQQLADPQTTLMILCNPQNPAGNIWDRETLARIGALCKQYDVIVVSDEIHCDLTKPGTEYIPFASVDDTCRDISVTCIAPTKTFNLAGAADGCRLCRKLDSASQNVETAQHRRSSRTESLLQFRQRLQLFNTGKNGSMSCGNMWKRTSSM